MTEAASALTSSGTTTITIYVGGVEEVATSGGMTTTTTTTYTAASMRIAEAVGRPDRYFRLYNHERTHQAPGYQTPAQIYRVAS